MTTTKTKPAAELTTEVTAPAPAVITFRQLPRSVTLSGLYSTVFPQAIVLARLGYQFDPNQHPELFPQTGLAFIHMTLGTPEVSAVAGAKEVTDQALLQEEREFEKRVEQAAKEIIEAQSRAAAKALADAQIAEVEAQLRRLKAGAA